MSEIETKTKQELCESLGKFLSIYHKTKIIEPKDDTLKMYILLSKNKTRLRKKNLSTTNYLEWMRECLTASNRNYPLRMQSSVNF